MGASYLDSRSPARKGYGPAAPVRASNHEPSGAIQRAVVESSLRTGSFLRPNPEGERREAALAGAAGPGSRPGHARLGLQV